MLGASRAALKASRAALQGLLQQADAGRLAEDLLAVSGVVGGNVVLLRALADPSREGSDKARLVARVFGGKVGEQAQQVVEAAVSQRWGAGADLAVALESLAVEALLAQAETEARLGRVEDELFRFNRIVGGTDDLRAALTDPRATPKAKGDMVKALLADKAAPETVRLAERAVLGTRLGRFGNAIEAYLRIAAQRQDQVTATVTSAVPLSEEQHERLVATLTEQYGRAVHTNVILDPHVVGGVRVEIGDEVIDGTISRRLDEARRRLTG